MAYHQPEILSTWVPACRPAIPKDSIRDMVSDRVRDTVRVRVSDLCPVLSTRAKLGLFSDYLARDQRITLELFSGQVFAFYQHFLTSD